MISTLRATAEACRCICAFKTISPLDNSIMRPAARLAAACRLPTTAARVLYNQKGPPTGHVQMHSKGPGFSEVGSSSCNMLVKPLLLVSDLDDTLVAHTTAAPGADAASAAFKSMWESSRAAGINCKLAINTGRTLPLFEAAWEAKAALLPQPDVLIAGVGTRCYHYNQQTGTWLEDGMWTSHMSEGWDPHTAKAVMDELIASFGPDNVEYRPAVEMHEHKLTVLYRKALRQQLMPHLHDRLQQAGVHASVIEGGAGRGPEWQFIDLLPTNAGKGSAMRYIQQQLGFEDDSTVASGDAMNDLLMLQQAPHAILVGNAVQELKQWAQQQQEQQQQQQQQQDSSVRQHVVYIAAEPVAAGVMEGLRALGMLQMQLPN